MKTLTFKRLKPLQRNEKGLSTAEAKAQLEKFGPNDIVENQKKSWIGILREGLRDPMIWFLILIGTALWAFGKSSDGIALFVAVIPLLAMDVFLHWRTEASTTGLRGQLDRVVRVFRDANEISIDAREIVPGDLLPLVSGQSLPADGVFEAASDLQLDESVLTGESLPVTKRKIDFDPFDKTNKEEVRVPLETIGFAGTRILKGRGSLRVLATGVQTSYGQITHSISQMPRESTPLQKAILRLVQILIFVAGLLCLALAFTRVIQGFGWLDALLSSATLAVAAIPEEFPVVFTFFLGVGVYRLAKQGALVRQAVSVENIGRVTVICTDKTGTITEGKLQLAHLDPVSAGMENKLLLAALSASNSQDDPMDLAIREQANQRHLNSPKVLVSFPFTEDRKRESAIVEGPSGKKAIAFVKGSPELILTMSQLSTDGMSYWMKRLSDWGMQGHKVIGIASKEIHVDTQEPKESLDFLGFLCFEDPLRPEVREAVSFCGRHGIQTLMITGDHPATALAIAKEAGFGEGTELKVINAETEGTEFLKQWKSAEVSNPAHIVARCTPLQKLEIVKSLKQMGETVAVTGDGINDVPALKAADIGIAMGERGSQSAKEVASIVLADDNFKTIVSAIKEGRSLFLNLQKSFEYLLWIHIPLVLSAAILPFMGFPIVFLPLHIVWLELVIHPTALLAFQSSKTEVSPRVNRGDSFFQMRDIARILGAGLLCALIVAWFFISSVNAGSELSQTRSMAIAWLVSWSGFAVLSLSDWKAKPAYILSATCTLLSYLAIQNSDSMPFLALSPLSQILWFKIFLINGALAFLSNFKIHHLLLRDGARRGT